MVVSDVFLIKAGTLWQTSNFVVSHWFSCRLPATVNIEKVTSSLSPEGVLTIEAPLSRQAIESSETTIPVNVDTKGGVVKK